MKKKSKQIKVNMFKTLRDYKPNIPNDIISLILSFKEENNISLLTEFYHIFILFEIDNLRTLNDQIFPVPMLRFRRY